MHIEKKTSVKKQKYIPFDIHVQHITLYTVALYTHMYTCNVVHGTSYYRVYMSCMYISYVNIVNAYSCFHDTQITRNR